MMNAEPSIPRRHEFPTDHADDRRGSHAAVGVMRAGGAFAVIALRPIAAGETVLAIDGVIVGRPSRHSLQIGADSHIELPADSTGARDNGLDRGVWKFLNHACDPNAAIDGRRLVALRAIARGEEVTFDYNTTEYDMAEPFPCACGACGGREIRGFRHLSAAEQRALRPRLAAYLRPLVDGGSEGGAGGDG